MGVIRTPEMGLTVWNSGLDPYNSQQLGANFSILEFHDHTPGRGKRIGTAAINDGAVTPQKLSAQQAWQTLTLPAGWSAPISYFKDSLGIVRFRQEIISSPATGATANLALGTLPAGYLPGVTQSFLTMCNSGMFTFTIAPSGNVAWGPNPTTAAVNQIVFVGHYRAEG